MGRIPAPWIGFALLAIGLAFFLSWSVRDEAGPTAVSRSASRLPGSESFDVGPGVWVSDPVAATLGEPARDLPLYQPEFSLDREINPRFGLEAGDDRTGGGIAGGVDSLLAVQASAPVAAPNAFLTPTLNFDGQGYTFVNPPDTVGEVGLNHYVQVINAGGGAILTIHDKTTGAITTGPIAVDALGSGGNCAGGSGDGIVLYDRLADRWLLSEFANSGNHLCVYISQTPDPAGAYFRYDFATPNFPDYPKYAVWPDAYYVSTNENSPAVYALDRGRMLVGAAATMQRFTAPDLAAFPFQALTPSDLDGANPPPPGAPHIFMRHRDDEAHNAGSNDPTQDFLEIWEFDVDFATPANSTFTGPTNIAIAEIDSHLCGFSSFACFEQPGTGTQLDPLREVVMWRLQYRNFDTHETLVGNLVTDVDGNDHGGIRWFELRRNGGGWSLHQEGTYAPDGHSRWMGSAAMDSSGNIAVAYNVSSSTLFPSLRYAGRLASDPLGTLPQGEVVLVAGTASNGSNRYGDYSSLNVDPADDCTFWFTGQYNSSPQWSTRIGVFRFDDCGSPDFTLTPTPSNQVICLGNDAHYNVDVMARGGFTDTITLSAINAPGTAVFDPSDVSPPGSSQLTISNASLGNYMFDAIGGGGGIVHTTTLALDVVQLPTAVTLLGPPDGTAGSSSSTVLTWIPVPGASLYLIEIASDPNFNTFVATGNVTGNGFLPLPLPVEQDLYWRVTPSNICGPGPVSPIWSFRTGSPSCTVYASTDVPKPITPSGMPTVTSLLTIAGSSTIVDLNVLDLNGTHTWFGDLDFNLTSPSGTDVRLMNRACGNADDFDLNLDDEAAPGSRPCPPVDGGTYRPDNPLRAFDSASANGTWELTVNDNADLDGGSLDGWSLEVCTVGATTAVDYSDLAGTYGAAWHEDGSSLRLGSNWDADAGYAPGQDDGSDDGVTFFSPLIPGQPFSLTLEIQGGSGAVNVWFDWNHDGDFSEGGELTFDQSLTTGVHVLNGNVPPAAQVADGVPYRVRLSGTTAQQPLAILPYGGLQQGEVTDGIAPGSIPTAVRLTQTVAVPTRSAAVLLCVVLATLTLIMWRCRPSS